MSSVSGFLFTDCFRSEPDSVCVCVCVSSALFLVAESRSAGVMRSRSGVFGCVSGGLAAAHARMQAALYCVLVHGGGSIIDHSFFHV